MGKIKKDKPAVDVKTKPSSPKKKSEKQNSEEWSRKYALIFPDSVKCVAETIGISNLSDEVASTLSEDVSYRLRGILQLCSKYMKHTRQKRLRVEDVNEVLKVSDIPVVLGHSTPAASTEFSEIQDAGVMILNDPVIDLQSYATTEVSVAQRPPFTLAGKWLPAEDQRPKLKVEDAKSVDTTDGKTSHNAAYIKADGEARPLDTHSLDNEPKIPTNLIKYYGITCNTILGYSDLKIVFRDLSRNEKILPIVPFLLNFITVTLSKLGSERQIMRLLQTVEALTENPRIDLRPYHAVTRVVNSLLKIIKTVVVERKRDLATNSQSPGQPPPQKVQFSYSHNIRIRSAQVLARMVRRLGYSEEQKSMMIAEMGTLLADLRLPPRVHVGAVALLKELGSSALCSHFWPQLQRFLAHLDSVRQDKAALEHISLEAAAVLYRCPHSDESTDCPTPQHLDEILYEHFGDGICPFRWNLLENPQFVHKFIRPPSTDLEYKTPDTILKGTWKLPRCIDSLYNPVARRATVENVFDLTKKRCPRITFKFVGSAPLPEMRLKRRRLDSNTEFIAGSMSEGHVVLVGKFWRRPNINSNKQVITTSLFSIL